MVRKLKYHEKKLLKKVDFITWKKDELYESQMIKKYFIKKREDFMKYKRLARHVKELALKIKQLDLKDPFRTEATSRLLDKLYGMGLIPTKRSLMLCERVDAVSFCRRRLPVAMVRLKMAQGMKAAVTFIEQGHVRVGPEVVTDPAFLVTPNMEDFVTWSHHSSIRKKVMEYNEIRDDFDM